MMKRSCPIGHSLKYCRHCEYLDVESDTCAYKDDKGDIEKIKI